MKKDLFKIFSIITILLSILIIGILNAIIDNIVPHISKVEFLSQNSIINPKIIVQFSNPISPQNAPLEIEIFPESKYSHRLQNNILIINFEETLKSNTQYSIKFPKDIFDTFGKKFEIDTIFFKTEELKLGYIKKSDNDIDKLIIQNIQTEEELVLLKHKDIKKFDYNSNYVVAIVETQEKTSDIAIVDRENNKTALLDLTNQNIISVAVNKNKNEFIYIAQDVEIKENYLLPTSLNKLFLFNIENNSIKTINPGNTANDVVDVDYFFDHDSIIYKSGDGTYYVASLSTFEFSPIGKFLYYGGSDLFIENLVFVNFNPLETYSSFPFISIFNTQRKETIITDQNSYVIDPTINFNGSYIFFAEKYSDFENFKGLFKINKYDLLNQETTEVLKIEEFSLELPSQSPDNDFVVFERYSKDALLDSKKHRNYIFQTKPAIGEIVIFSLKEKSIVKILKGIEAKWIY